MPGFSCSFYRVSPFNWIQKTLKWNWLVVSIQSNSSAPFALKIHISPLLLWETDAVMEGGRLINELLPLWEWMHRGCNIDSHTEWFSGSPDTESRYSILLQWGVPHQTSNPVIGFMATLCKLMGTEMSVKITQHPGKSQYKIHLQVS